MQITDNSSRWLGPALFAALAALLATSGTVPAQIIPGRYIAVLKQDTRDAPGKAKALAAQHGLQLDYVYTRAIKGFAFNGSEHAAAALARRGEVAYVEPDQICTAFQQTVATGIRRCDADAVPGLITGGGLMVDVDVAVIDTGLDPTHPDLNVVPAGIRFYQPKNRMVMDENWQDDHGHGTHVGGIIGALDNDLGVVGVAPGARLWPIKVLDDRARGTYAAIIAGVDWVVQRADTFEVANMSLGGSFSQAVNDAVKAGTQAGIVFVLAAGNSDADAAGYSPASEPTALTVSALADYDGLPGSLDDYPIDDWLATFSNYGEVVDVCAPGVDIYSTYLMSRGGYTSMSGTSMAAPHAAGAAALYIARHGLTKTAAGVEAVCAAIRDSGWQFGHYAYFHDWLFYDDVLDTIHEPLLNVAKLLYWETPPTLSLTAPADATKVTGGTPVQVTTSVSDVASVQFYLDGQFIGDDKDSSDGWSLLWDTTDRSDGLYTLVAVATAGTTQLAGDAILVGVNNNLGLGPSVRFVNPSSTGFYSQVFRVTGVTNVSATAFDMGPVTGMDFYYGETFIGSGEQQADGTWSLAWDTTGLDDGTNAFTAVATGEDGSQGVSLPVSVSVQNHAVHVGDLDRASTISGGTWTAYVTVTIHDGLHQPLPGATVYATWTMYMPDPPRPVSAVTDANGQCLFIQDFKMKHYSAVLTVDDVVPPPGSPGLYYNAAANHDPEGDSNGTNINVRPPAR